MSEQPLCDLCDERPATAKLVVFCIETLVCERCQNDDEEESEDTCPPDCWACQQESAK